MTTKDPRENTAYVIYLGMTVVMIGWYIMVQAQNYQTFFYMEVCVDMFYMDMIDNPSNEQVNKLLSI